MAVDAAAQVWRRRGLVVSNGFVPAARDVRGPRGIRLAPLHGVAEAGEGIACSDLCVAAPIAA